MITTKELSENLLKQISSVIDGNQAKADEIQNIQANSEIFQAHLTVNWKFKGCYEDQKIAGGKKLNNHFNHKNQFEHQTDLYCQQAAYEQTLRQNFLDNLASLHTSSLTESDRPHYFYHFEPFSLRKTCSNCGGAGQKSCSSCGGSGRITCSSCGGSGKQHYPVTTYDSKGNANGTRWDYRSCPSCSAGQCTCSTCFGRGTQQCSPCKGYGYFTIIRAVYAVAIPSYRIGTNANFAKYELEELLNVKGTTFCYNKIAFDKVKFQETADDECQFDYQGESFLLSQEFDLKSKTYHCYAFSNPPYPFIKPTIFDDLFADELAFLKRSIPENGKIDKRKSFEFFVRYSGQPVLEQSMREIAQHRTEKSQILAEKLEAACQGYISHKMAFELSSYLNKIIDKVSPAYSSLIWTFWAFISFIGAFILSEERFESSFFYSPFETIITILVVFGLGSFIVWLLSCLATLFARRKVPKEYRQKMRNKEPFKWVFKGVCIVSLLGAIYGYSASQGWLPRWNSIPTNWIISQIHSQKSWLCPLMGKIDWKPNICKIEGVKAHQVQKAKK